VGDDKLDALVGVGVSAIPGGGVAQKVWSIVRPPNAQERFERAKQDYEDELGVRLCDAIRAVQAEVQAHGLKLAQLSPHRSQAVGQQVAQAASEARSETKVEAILNAGARQFDPRMGAEEVRRHWLTRVATLTDLEVRVLMLLKERAPLFYFSSPGVLHWGERRELADMPRAECLALGSVLLDLQRANDLVTQGTTNAEIENYSTQSSILTARGEELLRFIRPIAPM
jgi:hypothetical protein